MFFIFFDENKGLLETLIADMFQIKATRSST
jgi:hypothetical protein